MKLLAALALAGAALAAARPAHAVERYAVVIGHNEGAGDETPLRYAEDDAAKLHDVLRDLGGFAPENMILLRGERAAVVRRTLIAVNDRLRTRVRQSVQAVLFVYYSGHADADALHLGGTELPLSELEQLVRGSSATVRLLVLDSCRSGALTRVKGGRRSGRLQIQINERLPGEGAVFLTSSSAREDAQESDELRGSFFTHYLVSGLVGPADENGDQRVSLEEAYRYAYTRTLAASSRTLAGPQHPTFRYDLSGQGDFTLTRLKRPASRRASLSFPSRRSYFVIRGDKEGPVVAEVGLHDRHREVMVAPGRYFVRGRGRDHLLEGYVTIRAGQARAIGDGSLERVEYDRLVRKGGGILDHLHLVNAGYRTRSPLVEGGSLCHGLFAGYGLELAELSLAARAGFCRGGHDNPTLSATTDEIDGEIRLSRGFDPRLFTVHVGVAAGASLLRQEFETRGVAPGRSTAAAHTSATLAVSRALGAGLLGSVDVGGQTYFYREAASDGSGGEFGARFALRVAIGLGLLW